MNEQSAAAEECDDLKDELSSMRTRHQCQVEGLVSELQEANKSGTVLASRERVESNQDLSEENVRLQDALASVSKAHEDLRKEMEAIQLKQAGRSQAESE